VVRSSFAALATALALASSCAPLAGPVDVEVLVRDDDDPDGYRFEIVTLQSVTDLRTGRGDRFDVRAGLSTYNTPSSDPATLGAASFDELVTLSRSGGDDVRAELIDDGGVWRARDFDTLHYLTAFANLEAAFSFIDDVVQRPFTSTTEHTVASLYGTVLASPELPVEITLADNAAYIPNSDIFLITPAVSQVEGLPPFMDVGAAVHELHHRVTHHRLMRDERLFGHFKAFAWPHVFRQDEISNDPDPVGAVARLRGPEELRTFNELRGFDEGIADLFAVGLSGDPAFLDRFFPLAADLRSLEGPLALVGNFADVEDGSLGGGLDDACNLSSGGGNLEVQGINYYCLGTVLAAAVWDAVGADRARLNGEVLPAVEDGLDLLVDDMAARSDAEGRLFFSTQLGLDALVRAASPATAADLCASFEVRFARLVEAGEVPSCP
jgi:hypothetical protein